MVSFQQPFQLNATNTFVGPVATSSFLSADFTSNPNTGAQTISQDVWGAGASTFSSNNYTPLNDVNLQNAMKQIPLTFYRQNARSGVGNFTDPNTMESAFAPDGTFQNWNGVDPFINRWPLCFNNFTSNPPKFIMGVSADVTYFNSPAIFGNVCQQFAQHFKNTNSSATGQPVPIFGWEVGNETNGNTGDSTYNSYFNAAADGFHAVDSNYKMFGPTYSFVQAIPSSFVQSCGSRCHALGYHLYKFGGNNNPGTAAILDMTVNPSVFRPSNDLGVGFALCNTNGHPEIAQFFGEWAMDDTPSSSADPQQQDFNGAVFAAQWILDGLKVNKNLQYGGIWEIYHDQQYGLIQGTGGPAGGIAPSGFMMAKATQTMYGTRVFDSGVKTVNTGNCLNMLSVKDVTLPRFAVMIINFKNPNPQSGQVALSHWNINNTGTASINKWEISQAHPTGQTTSLNVTAGLTDSINIPGASVVILSSP